MDHALRHLKSSSTFGDDKFGSLAERFATFFGTPKFIITQSTLIVVWIMLNAAVVTLKWDPYPFILLNLLFSTQAAYAAPLILLAQTRQTVRDKTHAEASAKHNQEESDLLKALIEDNTILTKQVAELASQIKDTVDKKPTRKRKTTPES